MPFGFDGMHGHHMNHPYFGYGGNPHKYGYVPNGHWGNQPYPLSAKERETWNEQKNYMSEFGQGKNQVQQDVIIKDH
tara:strand:+ start:406 stop:636 length:231 start_codon:yes stop_codon:yes gene_type:complete